MRSHDAISAVCHKLLLQIASCELAFSTVFKSVEKHHLINFTQGREQHYCPVVLVVSFSSFPFE